MAFLGKYKRNQDDKEGMIHDTVKMEIKADNNEDRAECLNDMMLFHQLLEKHGVVLKNDSE